MASKKHAVPVHVHVDVEMDVVSAVDDRPGNSHRITCVALILVENNDTEFIDL